MSTASEMLQKYLDAESAVLEGKTVRFGEKLVTLEDLEWIQKGRREWETRVSVETSATSAAHSRRPFQVVA